MNAIEKEVGKGKIVASHEGFEVTAPNAQKFKGKVLIECRVTLEDWWSKNGGSDTFQEFDEAIREIAEKLTPNSCC